MNSSVSGSALDEDDAGTRKCNHRAVAPGRGPCRQELGTALAHEEGLIRTKAARELVLSRALPVQLRS